MSFYDIDETGFDEGWHNQTSEVVLGDQVRLQQNKIESIIQQTDNLLYKTDYDRISTFHNLKIFITGTTGLVGGAFARHLVLNANDIYCLVRPGKDIESATTADDRLADWVDLARVGDYDDQVHLVEGSYRSKSRMGIEPEMWDWLCENIDIIFSCGHRTSLNMSWVKAGMGVLNPSLQIIKLSRSHHLKPIVSVGSCGERLAMQQAGRFFTRGYSMSKHVDQKGFEYLRRRTKHPIRIVYISYVSDQFYQLPSWHYTNYAMIKVFFLANFTWKGSTKWQLIDTDQMVMASLVAINFDPRTEMNQQMIMGAFSAPEDMYTIDEIYDIVREIQPQVKVGTSEEYFELYEKYLQTQAGAALEKEDPAHLLDIAPPETENLVFVYDSLYEEPPPNSLRIAAPNTTELARVFRYIHDASSDDMRYAGKYYGGDFLTIEEWEKFDAEEWDEWERKQREKMAEEETNKDVKSKL